MISYSARTLGAPYQLYVMNADGSAPYQVFMGFEDQDVYNRCWIKPTT